MKYGVGAKVKLKAASTSLGDQFIEQESFRSIMFDSFKTTTTEAVNCWHKLERRINDWMW